MRFGVAIPTCTEGLVYPLPFSDHRALMDLTLEAEQLGFDSILVNDHLSTQGYVRDAWPDPPRYYEPLMTLAWVAARTSVIRLMTGVIVLPVREPVVLAKQVSTLDHLSDGRVTLGVGVGAYREEYEAVRPDLRGHTRAVTMGEGLQALRTLFTDPSASMDGEVVRFTEVEMHPKPVQDPLPIYSSGNAEGTLRRAARWCDGWMPAGIGMARLEEGMGQLRELLVAEGREPDAVRVAPQLVIGLGTTTEAATELFLRSQVHEHLVSLQQSTLRDVAVDTFVSTNLIGTPDQVVARIREMAALGVEELAGLIVIGNTPEELAAQMRMVAEEVIPAVG